MADPRKILLLATPLLLAAAAAGCLAGGEELSPAGETSTEPGNATGSQPPANDTGNGSAGNEANRSEEGETTEDRGPNGTGSDDEATNATAEGNRTASGEETTTDGRYDPGWPPIEDARIRPGVGIGPPTRPVAVGAWGCTANFLFSSSDNRTLYLGTAAHCFDDAGLQAGDPVSIGGGIAEGTLAYNSFATAERHGYEDEQRTDRNDFALVRIPEEARDLVHPAMEHFGGPTDLGEAPAPEMKVMSYGNSSFREPDPAVRGTPPDNLDPREGYLAERTPWQHFARFNTTAIPADSGSPVIDHEGHAIGLVKTLEITPNFSSGNTSLGGAPTENGLVPMTKAVAFAENHTRLELELKTWPLIENGQLPQQSPVPLRPPGLPR
jgi:hypothetical protein